MMFFKDESGASMVEYALIFGLIAIVALVVLVALSPKVKNAFDVPNRELDKAV